MEKTPWKNPVQKFESVRKDQAIGAWSVLAIIVAAVVTAVQYMPYQLDDAYIYYRYAQVFSETNKLAFNIGTYVAVEGFSSPLWMAACALVAKAFGADWLPLATSLLGLIALVGSIFAIAAIAKNARNDVLVTDSMCAVFAAALFATMPGVLFYAVSGLETLWFIWLLLICLGYVGKAFHSNSALLATALLPWVRPEAMWVLFCLPLMSSILLGRNDRHWRRVVQQWLVLAGSCGILFLVRWLVFSELLPNTYFAKAPDYRAGVEYVLYFSRQIEFVVLALLAITSAVLGSSVSRAWLALAGLWCVSVVLAGGDWMPQARFMLPVYAFLIIASAPLLVVKVGKWYWPKMSGMLIAAILIVCTNGLSTMRYLKTIQLTLATSRHEGVVINQWLVAAGVKSVAAIDIGLLAYMTPLRITDLAGLTDATIAGLPGGHLQKPISFELLRQRSPEVILLRTKDKPLFDDQRIDYQADSMIDPVEQNLVKLNEFDSLYEPWIFFGPLFEQRQPLYGRLLFKRRDIQLDKGELADRYIVPIPPKAWATSTKNIN